MSSMHVHVLDVFHVEGCDRSGLTKCFGPCCGSPQSTLEVDNPCLSAGSRMIVLFESCALERVWNVLIAKVELRAIQP